MLKAEKKYLIDSMKIIHTWYAFQHQIVLLYDTSSCCKLNAYNLAIQIQQYRSNLKLAMKVKFEMYC